MVARLFLRQSDVFSRRVSSSLSSPPWDLIVMTLVIASATSALVAVLAWASSLLSLARKRDPKKTVAVKTIDSTSKNAAYCQKTNHRMMVAARILATEGAT